MPLFSSFIWFSTPKAHMKHLGHFTKKKKKKKACAWVPTQNKEIRVSGREAQAAAFLDVSLSGFRCSIMNENHCCRYMVVSCLLEGPATLGPPEGMSHEDSQSTPGQRIRIRTLVRVPEGLHTHLAFEKYWNNQWLSTLTACKHQSRSF